MVGLVGQVVVKGSDGGDLPGPGRGVETVVGIGAVVVLDPVAAEVSHVAIDVRQGHRRHKLQIHIHDVDFIQRFSGECRITDLLHVAEEIPKIKEVFVDGALGMGLDGFVIG